jgi:hypothetical protein
MTSTPDASKLAAAERRLWEAITAAASRTAGHRRLRHTSPYALVLEAGEWHHPAPLPASCGHWRGQPKDCFASAARLADARPDLRYVEGYADPGIDGFVYPFEHAWCVDASGAVVDPTWIPVGHAYLGVPLTPRFRRERQQHGVSVLLAIPDNADLLVRGLPAYASATDVLDVFPDSDL